MSLSAVVRRILFPPKTTTFSSDAVIHHRFLSFLIWQTLQSSLTFLFAKTLLAKTSLTSLLLAFIAFQFANLLFSTALFSISSPQLFPFASGAEVLVSSVRLLFVSGGDGYYSRVRLSLRFVAFVLVCGVCGGVGVSCLCGGVLKVLWSLGFKGFVVGVCYGTWYVWKQRWVLQFPIVQRPPFFSYKMGLPSSFTQALKLSAAGYVLSGFLSLFVPVEYRSQSPMGVFILEQIILYIASFSVVLCWELSHHLHQVLHSKRFVFAPPKGSAAAATDPSETLLATLEESTPKSLLQYLAYLDLSMVCENNVDTWRRGAFFEESGETYKRVIAACLKPLDEFTQKVAKSIESSSAENALLLPHQLSLPTERLVVSKLHELLFDSQLYAWCAQIISSLTARSHKEDRFGVAQISRSNPSVISTLLSSLLAVETMMGKKTIIQSTSHVTGHNGIKWATMTTVRRESMSGDMIKFRNSPLYVKAYSLADVLKTSIYCIVSTFHDEMMSSDKGGLLEKEWVSDSKPLYGTHELLLYKLRLFLEYQAS